MSIRYECEGCGSVLKIKESLAGTSGKCPHCKHKFIVPEKGADSGVGIESAVDSKIQKTAPPPAPAKVSSPAPSVKPTNGDDFDLDAFLMDDKVPGAKASAGLSAPPAAPVAPQPMFDKQGRRTIAAPPPSPGSSAELPARDPANSAINASANARDLLTKSMEDGRLKAGSMPGAPRKPLINIDLLGSITQLRQYALYIVGGIVLVFGLYWLSDRMMSDRLPLPKLAPVSGTVTLNGDPLPNVTVHLSPVNSAEGKSTTGKPLRLRDAIGVTDGSGFYEVQYMNGIPGAPLGRSRVWIECMDPAVYRKLPPQALSAGTDMREVKEVGNESRFNIEFKSP